MTRPLVGGRPGRRGLSLLWGLAMGEGVHPHNPGVCPYAQHCGEAVRKALRVA